MFDRYFELSKNHTTIRIEVLAGITTFLTMAYIIFVNPTVLSSTGMDKGAVFVATCLAAAFGSAMMGLLANYPIALAPGMGLNAYFTYSVVLGGGYTWQVALGAVFISGILFLILSIFPIREYIINSIPTSLKVAIVAGIGLFLGIIGFKTAGIIAAHPVTFVTLGNLHNPTTLLAILGFFLIIALEKFEITGAIIISILVITGLSILLGYTKLQGIFSLPPSILPTLWKMDFQGVLNFGMISIVLAFLFVDFFDNTGTLIAIAVKAKLMDKGGKLPRLNRALLADSAGVLVGATLGTSPTTSYIESAVGVKAGGRTGLTAVVVAILFLLALFFSPLAASIPSYATAPTLIYISCLMSRAFIDFDWQDITEYVPGLITVIAMPLTYSIAEGISFGFISYTVIKLITGRYRDLNLPMIVLAACFVMKYVYLK